MACEILRIDGNILYVRISGVMKLAEQQVLQVAGKKIIEQAGTARLLVTLENFQGWEKGADWGDVGFMLTTGKSIAKMALVGDKRWEEDILVFVGKGIRSTEIEFFSPAAAKEAEAWIRS